MKLLRILVWIILLGYWIYKIYTNNISEKGNTMYYIAGVVSVLGLVKTIYDYKNSLKEE